MEQSGNSTIDLCVEVMEGIIVPGKEINYLLELNDTETTQGKACFQ